MRTLTCNAPLVILLLVSACGSTDSVELQLTGFSANNGAEFHMHEFCGGA